MNKDDPKFKQIHTYLVKLQVHNISTLEMISSHCEISDWDSKNEIDFATAAMGLFKSKKKEIFFGWT